MILEMIGDLLTPSFFFFRRSTPPAASPSQSQSQPLPLGRPTVCNFFFVCAAGVSVCILSVGLVAASGSLVAFRRFLGEPRVSDFRFLLEVIA